MDKKKTEYYKNLLIKLQNELAHDIHNMSANVETENGDSGHVQHMADVATDMYDREFTLGLAANEREIVAKIESALKRLEKGSYGSCNECDKLIPVARLKALPYVETCLKCQEKIESGQ